MAREDVVVFQRVVDARLMTRSDKPDVGILALMHYSLCIPVAVDGWAITPQIGAVAGTVIAFSSEAQAWDWLEQHNRRSNTNGE